jgi:hypothetical protein
MKKIRSSYFILISLSVIVLFILTSGMSGPTQAHAQAENMGNVSYTWHTFYGTSGVYDDAVAVTVDATGNSYILGSSMLLWNGPAGEAPLHAHNPGSNMDVFILKLNSAGEYQWHTFYGGLSAPLTDSNNSTNDPYDIELDANGNIFVMGTSRNSWGAPLHAHSGLSDSLQGNLFVMKLSPSGTYLWHTFYEQMRSITSSGGRRLAVDGNGNAYVATTVKLPWRDTLLVPLHSYSGIPDGETWNSNMLILKLNPAGEYQWHTFYGTQSVDSDDFALDIAADAGGNTYVTGAGTDWGTPLHANSGFDDIIVLKLNTNGSYQWHSYYGSANPLKNDEANGITLDPGGNIFVSGVGRPFLGPSGQQPLHGFSDAGETPYNDDTFVLKLTPQGGYVWHTWYGSAGQEKPNANKPVTDGDGNVYVIGNEGSEAYPFNASNWDGPDGQTPLRPFTPGSGNNFFVLKLTSAGDYRWHMFFNSKSFGFDLTLDSQDNLSLTSSSQTSWNGPDGQVPLHALSGGAYIVKYSYDLFRLQTLSPASAAVGGPQFSLTVTGENFLDGAVVQWNSTDLGTTWVNATTLTAVVPADKLLNLGAAEVRVINPEPDAATSNPLYVFISQTGAGIVSQGSAENTDPEGTARATTGGTGAFSPGSITATGSGSGRVVVGIYNANPGGSPTFPRNTSAYTDVHILPGSSFTSLSMVNCTLNGGNTAYWWNGSSWLVASNQSYNKATECVTITVNGSTSPNLDDLTGTPFAVGFNGTCIYLPMVMSGEK